MDAEKKGANPGDIIEIFPQKYFAERVWVESMTDDQEVVEVKSGSLAILIRRLPLTAVVMTDSGFMGWVYDDEWRCAKA